LLAKFFVTNFIPVQFFHFWFEWAARGSEGHVRRGGCVVPPPSGCGAQQVPDGFALLVIIVSLLANNSIQIVSFSCCRSRARGWNECHARDINAPPATVPASPYGRRTAQRANSVIFNFSPLWSQTIYTRCVRYDTRRLPSNLSLFAPRAPPTPGASDISARLVFRNIIAREWI
jgi:hypothetical protein